MNWITLWKIESFVKTPNTLIHCLHGAIALLLNGIPPPRRLNEWKRA